MNKHKALLDFSGTENFLQHIINVYCSAGVEQIIVVKNAGIPLAETGLTGISEKDDEQDITGCRTRIVENASPKKGRIYSLQLGLSALYGADYCYLQNIDNPFVTKELIADLYEHRMMAAYITPQCNNQGGHPVLMSRRVMNTIKNLATYDLALREVLNLFSRYKMQTEDENCLVNINSPEDYETLVLRRK